MSHVPRSLLIGAISLITLGCGPKHIEPSPAEIRAADSVTVTADSTAPRWQFQVTKPALVKESGAPPSPHGVMEGSVLVQFVVGTDGRPEMSTFKVLSSTDDELSAAVRRIIPTYRFWPAEANGKKVRQYVQMPFRFVGPNH